MNDTRGSGMNHSINTVVQSRPVTFGNPALGTYFGCVYTLASEENGNSNDNDNNNNDDGYEDKKYNNSIVLPKEATKTSIEDRLVAMVDVPPEQVPEGILNISRSYRDFIQLVRIVIASAPPSSLSTRNDDYDGTSQLTEDLAALSTSTTGDHSTSDQQKHRTAVECAASIMASSNNTSSIDVDDDDEEELQPSRTYLVLIELSSTKAASAFVRDLHEKPYTSFEPDVQCKVYHVVGLEGKDGVSLMSPFFAPSTCSSSSKKAPAVLTSAAPTGSIAQQQQVGSSSIARPCSLSHDTTESASALSSNKVPPASPAHLAATSTATTETQNCPVCLERMDLAHEGNTSGSILTTVCNHSFHMECLLQWQDSPCPVCRYDHSGLNEALSQCHVCGKTEHNYVCLICGVVACGWSPGSSVTNIGQDATTEVVAAASNISTEQQHHVSRMAYGHARQHYLETLHAYALDTETQHVWDFVGQGYVHRLIQNAKDDKLVEFSDPNNNSSYERSLCPGLSDAQEGEVVHRKLEGFASQYYTLLKSQLEQQRIFYEGRLEEIRREYGQQKKDKKKKRPASADLISALKQERNQLTQRCMSLRSRLRKVSDDVRFLKDTTEGLEANKIPLKKQLEQVQRERADTKEMIESSLPPLQDKVMMLMLQLEESMQDDSATVGNDDRKPAAKNR